MPSVHNMNTRRVSTSASIALSAFTTAQKPNATASAVRPDFTVVRLEVEFDAAEVLNHVVVVGVKVEDCAELDSGHGITLQVTKHDSLDAGLQISCSEPPDLLDDLAGQRTGQRRYPVDVRPHGCRTVHQGWVYGCRLFRRSGKSAKSGSSRHAGPSWGLGSWVAFTYLVITSLSGTPSP